MDTMAPNTRGLTRIHAEEKLKKYGRNEIQAGTHISVVRIFIRQFASVLVGLLVLAAVLSFFIGDRLDALLISLIIALNAVLGFVQEFKAEKAIEALKKITVTTVRVIRDGKEQLLDSALLVPGDIIKLEAGDKVPADGIVLESIRMEVNEASLTGESIPVEKNVKEDNKKHVFLGTTVVGGHGTVQIQKTGMDTKFGKLARSLAGVERGETPLQKKVKNIGFVLGGIAVLASAVMFFVGFLSGESLTEMLIISMSLAVAAVPEGLPAVMTITLAVGVQRMAKRKAAVRKLAAIEAMGAASLIATDKTGTLTQNRMTVTHVWCAGKEQVLSHEHKLSDSFRLLLNAGVLCNNATLIDVHDHGSSDVLGDSTEGALLKLAKGYGVTRDDLEQNRKLVDEHAFDSEIKRMSTVWKEGKLHRVYVKGAPEHILEKSTEVLSIHGREHLSEKHRDDVRQAYTAYAKKGLRVLALAYKDVERTPVSRKSAENDLVFIGFVGIQDPPRDEVKDAILKAKSMGIRTVMVTGDNALTAHAIASQLGLMEYGDTTLTGDQLDEIDDHVLIQKLTSVRIFARATPEHKLRIVRLYQQLGKVVAVTGDGINDALAIKQGDIGVSMGITGTDVAKETADVVLMDDNYATLVVAIEEGRTIFDNMKATIKYLLACNLGEIGSMLVATLLGFPVILTPFQLLFINLVTDGLPAITLALTPKRDGMLSKKPQSSTSFFGKRDGLWFVEVALLETVFTIMMFWVGLKAADLAFARTLAFTTLVAVQLFVLLDVWVREESLMRLKLLKNPLLLAAFGFPLLIQLGILYIPQLSFLFKVTSIPFPYVVMVFAVSFLILPVAELRKVLLRRRDA